MDLYTLTDQFLAKDVVDEFVSAIWTERYSDKGDVQLVVPATSENLEKLKDGTFLALRGTKEVMELQTMSIEDRMATIVGHTLDGFLDNRLVWFKNPNYDDGDENSPLVVDYSELNTAGEFLANVVEMMVITPGPAWTGDWALADLNLPYEAIANLELGLVDTSGTAKRFTIPTGPLYSGLEQLARQEGLGFSLYLDVADEVTGYVLKFTTYRGFDHTSDGAYPLVRLTPDMDSLSEIKEIRSRANWKNVCYVWYKNEISKHLADPAAPEPEGFERRVMVVDAEGEPVGRKVVYNSGSLYGGTWTRYVIGAGEIAAFRAQNAKDALAMHNYVLAIDGQTSPINDYKYGIDYGLGDIIELEGITGAISKARVTEYIRSQDKNGAKEYPTISVLGGE